MIPQVRKQSRSLLPAAMMFLGLLWSNLGSEAAAAEGETLGRQALVLWYRGAEACPTGTDFVTLLTKRETPARVAHIGDRIDFVVTLGSEASGYAGRLERQTASGTVAIREVRAVECAEVAEALALSLALVAGSDAAGSSSAAGDVAESDAAGASIAASGPVGNEPPGSRRDAAGEGDSTLPGQSGSPQSKNGAALEPASHAGSPSSSPARATSDIGPGAPRRPSSGRNEAMPRDAVRDAARARWALGGGGSVYLGAAPSALFGPLVFGQWWLRHGGILSPSIRAEFGRMSGSEPTTRGAVEAALVVGGVDLCPIRIESAGLFTSPCVTLGMGSLSMNGTGASGVDRSEFWSTVAAAAQVGWSAEWLLLELRGALHLPLDRYRVNFQNPPQTVHETASTVLQAEIVVGLQIP